ncbi:poly(A) RNA polymerase gld-2 homolog A-like [Bacillus rossius redtenbacheri]|uniref:poly(A) RNA polymerase gld-2 homolog A-like n=1 Tax=Bacillus rossius redtenbacheri TaxID=93214 RepID=UPI002FDE2149
MYHAMFQPYTYSHLTGHHNLQQQNTIDCHNIHHNIFGSSSLPTIDFVHLVAIKMPPIRNRSFENQSQETRGSWRDRGSNFNCSVPPFMPPPSHPAFRQHHNNQGGKKNNFWNNKNMSRPPRCTVQDSAMTDTYSSDSGFSSRSPTPINHHQGDQFSTEENVDSPGSNSIIDVSKGIKRSTEVPAKTGSTTFAAGGGCQLVTVPPHPPPPLPPPQTFYSHHQVAPTHVVYGIPVYGQHRNGAHDHIYPGPNKRRYQNGRHWAPSLYRSQMLEIKDVPGDLIKGGEWDALSAEVWKKFITNQQSNETYRRKIGLWKGLFSFIKNMFPRYGLYLVGSTISGFGSNRSDVDMCLLVRHAEMDQRNEAVVHLELLLKCLRRLEFVNNLELIQAKVPILKFRDARQGLEVDLNCNNAVGIRNTHLLYCYSQMDWRVRPLVLIVKLWAQHHDINDAKNMTISSYSLVLMVIHFLQCGVTPSVLPCLHDLYQGKFSPHSDVQHIDVHEVIPPYFTLNRQPLGQLLLEFLQYYASFDYSLYAVSVRLASRIPIEDCRRARTYKNDPHQWKYLCIEEPFDLTNTARSVYDRDVFEKVKHVFVKSFNHLKKTKKLESIFRLDAID